MSSFFSTLKLKEKGNIPVESPPLFTLLTGMFGYRWMGGHLRTRHVLLHNCKLW